MEVEFEQLGKGLYQILQRNRWGIFFGRHRRQRLRVWRNRYLYFVDLVDREHAVEAGLMKQGRRTHRTVTR